MPIIRGVLAQSPEPEAHDKVLDNNPDRIGIWKCWFLRRGKPEYPEKNLSEQGREPTTNSTHSIHIIDEFYRHRAWLHWERLHSTFVRKNNNFINMRKVSRRFLNLPLHLSAILTSFSEPYLHFPNLDFVKSKAEELKTTRFWAIAFKRLR